MIKFYEFLYLLTYNSKVLQIVCVKNQEYALFSQATSNPIPYHIPTIKDKLGGKNHLVRVTVNGIKAPYYTNHIFMILY